jgi:hypothetical protein
MAMGFTVIGVDDREIGRFWLGSLDRAYCLPSGQVCRAFDQAVWCHSCKTFAAAEQFRELPEIKSVLADLQLPLAEMGSQWNHSFPRCPGSELEAEDARIEWSAIRRCRSLRQSPPRCFNCFATDIVALGSSGELRHPLTQERISIRWRCHMSLGHVYLYDSEGLPFDGESADWAAKLYFAAQHARAERVRGYSGASPMTRD